MKKIEELGISPAPWTVEGYTTADGKSAANAIDESGVIVGDFVLGWRNATLAAAAPELYKYLREAICETCRYCPNYDVINFRCMVRSRDCYVHKWRSAIEKAAGESEERQ